MRSCKEYHLAGFQGRQLLRVDNGDINNVICVLNASGENSSCLLMMYLGILVYKLVTFTGT